MRFVIVGFGRVGSRTALLLREEGHNVVVIEEDPDRADVARKRGFEVITGPGTNRRTLEEAGIADADGIASLTGDANDDFEACMIGKEHGARTVMRIDEDYVPELYEGYKSQVDDVIYPERLGAAGAKTALLGGNVEAIADLTRSLQVVTVTVPEGAPIIGERVAAIDLDGDARIYAHGAEHDPMTIPLPGTTVAAGDRLAVLVSRDAMETVREHLIGARVVQ